MENFVSTLVASDSGAFVVGQVPTRLMSVCALLCPSWAQTPCYEETVAPSNGQVDDCFGEALDIAGGVMVIGAPGKDGIAVNEGAAYIFERRNGRWEEEAYLVSGDPLTLQSFGSEVATDGVHVFVQSRLHTQAVVPPGGSTVHVYEKIGGSWTLTQRLYDGQNQSGGFDNFGFDIEVDSDRALIFNFFRRVIHIFEKSGANWVEVDAIDSSAMGPFGVGGGASFGYNLAVDGDFMAITHAGATNRAHILEYDGVSWMAVAELAANEPQVFVDASVAIEGDQAFVGSWTRNGQTGAVWVYQNTGPSWSWGHTQTLEANDASTSSRYGSAVSVDGDLLSVGASVDDGALHNAGAVYLLARDQGGQWEEVQKILSGSPVEAARLGARAKLEGSWVYVGGPGDHVIYGGALHAFRGASEIGVPFGVANPNSSGLEATLFARGSSVVDHNCLVLEAAGMPPGQFGYFLMSRTQGYVQLFGGSQGVLLLGLPLSRFANDIIVVTPLGDAQFTPDLSQLPQGIVVQPGETWNFQMWFRDTNPGQTSNTTNGLAVAFETSGTPAVQFPSTLLELEEDTTQFELAISLSQPSLVDVVVPYTIRGSATNNVDWRSEEPNPIIVPAGETVIQMTIVVAEDDSIEGTETGVITLGAPSGGVLGTAPEFTLTIVDDD